MKKQISLLLVTISLSTFGLSSCKNDRVSPKTTTTTTESVEIQSLKQYYAGIAKVDESSVIYDASTDGFSINGTAKISHSQLLTFYNLSKNAGQPILLNK